MDWNEFSLQAYKMLPWNWTGPKVALALLVILVIWTGLKTTGRDPQHKWLMAMGYVGLLILFAYGLYMRGPFGSVGKTHHGSGFYVFFFPHIAAGAFFLIGGAFQLIRMTRLHYPHPIPLSPVTITRHRSLGRWLVRASFILGFFGLAL